MCAFLYPDEYLDSTYSIDFDQLYKEGYRGIIFDIDNTLVPHGAPADERAISLFAHLKELGFHCMLLSNNREPRVKMFKAVRVSQSDGDPWHGHDKYTFCGRSDLYGCVWGKFSRNPHDPCKTDPPERRNPDRVKAPAGGNCAFMLSSAP